MIFSVPLQQDEVDDLSLKEASVLLRDACKGDWMKHRNDPVSLERYNFFKHGIFTGMTYVVLIIFHLIILIEKPTTNGWVIPFWVPITVEVICLSFFMIRLLQHLRFCNFEDIKKDKKHLTMMICITLLLLDIIGYSVWVVFDGSNKRAKRILRIIRPIIMVCVPQMRQLRRGLRSMFKATISAMRIFVLYFFFIVAFTLIGVELFREMKLTYSDGRSYFQKYWFAALDLFTLFTTANNPDVMIPGTHKKKHYYIFFILYTTITYVITANVMMAVIYNSYKQSFQNEIKTLIYRKRRYLTKAFDLIATRKGFEYGVERGTWHRLMRICHKRYSSQRNDILFDVVRNENDRIDLQSFLKVEALLNIKLVEIKVEKNVLQKSCPSCYNSDLNKMLIEAFQSKWGCVVFEILCISYIIVKVLQVEDLDWPCLVLFSLEIILNMYCVGFVEFICQFWNIFNFSVTLGGLICQSALTMKLKPHYFKGWLNMLAIIRVFRLMKLFSWFHHYNVIISTFIYIAPPGLVYILSFLILVYAYSIIGMEMFGGLIRETGDRRMCGNILLNGSEFANLGYCDYNFNDALNSWMFLYNLFIVNNWHIMNDALVKISTGWAILYTIVYILFVTNIIMNIIVSFVMDAFLVECDLKLSEIETGLEHRIQAMGAFACVSKSDEAHGIRYSFQKGTDASLTHFKIVPHKAKTMDTLLQRLFEAEFTVEDLKGEVSSDASDF